MNEPLSATRFPNLPAMTGPFSILSFMPWMALRRTAFAADCQPLVPFKLASGLAMHAGQRK
jgi:hypothetical protein